MRELTVKNITSSCIWRNSIPTIFPEQYLCFKHHKPKSDVYEGEENWERSAIFEIEFERKYPVGIRTEQTRLEVWYKGGDWNENPFYYFCIGQNDAWGKLYYIPQLSPCYKVFGDENSGECVEIEPTINNIMKFIKKEFLCNDGEITEKFEDHEVDCNEN